MRKNILEKKFNVRLAKTREQIDSHRAYWEVWYNGEPIIDAWTLAEAQEKLSKMRGRMTEKICQNCLCWDKDAGSKMGYCFRGGIAVDYTAADDSCQDWEENDEREAGEMPVLRE